MFSSAYCFSFGIPIRLNQSLGKYVWGVFNFYLGLETSVFVLLLCITLTRGKQKV